MNNRITQKEVAVGEKRYLLKKIDARAACWLFTFLGGKSIGNSIIVGLGACTRQEFDEVQSLVLKPILCLDHSDDGKFELPILAVNGSIVDDNLKDASNLFNLTAEAITFNLEPFLAEKGSNSANSNLTTAGNQ